MRPRVAGPLQYPRRYMEALRVAMQPLVQDEEAQGAIRDKMAVRMWPTTAGLHVRGQESHLPEAPKEEDVGLGGERQLPEAKPVVWPSHRELIKSLPPGLRKPTMVPIKRKKGKKKKPKAK